MFVSSKIVFTELHKTGGTHIGNWLNRLIGGEQIGKHNRVPASLQNRFIIGSIRNPWDWYVSLWAYGCSGQGSVRHQSTRRIDLRYCYDELPHEMGKHYLTTREWATQLAADWKKPVSAWRATYCDPDDPIAFRTWLKMLLDENRKFDIGEGFGFSPISRSFGLLTYRYMKLFTNLGKVLYSDEQLSTLSGLTRNWKQYAFVDHIIRNEQLENDLLDGLRRAGVTPSREQENLLISARNNKINKSERRETSHYYDKETIELVSRRETLIIERHSYSAPQLP